VDPVRPPAVAVVVEARQPWRGPGQTGQRPTTGAARSPSRPLKSPACNQLCMQQQRAERVPGRARHPPLALCLSTSASVQAVSDAVKGEGHVTIGVSLLDHVR